MKTNVFASCAALCGFLLASPIMGFGQQTNAGSKLQVHLSYSGSDTGDGKHKIYVVLWDSPEFVRDHPTGQGPMPFLALEMVADAMAG